LLRGFARLISGSTICHVAPRTFMKPDDDETDVYAGTPAPTGDQRPSLVNPEKPIREDISADEIRDVLKLESNATCGFARETYKCALQIAPGGLPASFENGPPRRHRALFYGDARGAGEASPHR
jgi:hypothetical protein